MDWQIEEDFGVDKKRARVILGKIAVILPIFNKVYDAPQLRY